MSLARQWLLLYIGSMSVVAALTLEQLDTLGEEIATFATRIDAAEHALLTRLRVFDAHEAWGSQGARSCAEWLSWRTNLSIKAAREKVRVARALGSLPKIDALFGRGELSYSKVRALTRAATAESEQFWIDVALHASASQIEKMARAYQRVTGEEASRDPMDLPNNQRRFVRRSETVGGMVRIEMQLTPEEAAVLWSAMNSALEQAPAEAPGPAREAPAGASMTPQCPDRRRLEIEEQRADAVVDLAQAYLQHRPRTLGSGYEMVVITTPEHLQRGPDGVGGYLPDGTPVPLHVARMLACDGARVDVTLGRDGELLDVGRRTRAIPSAIGRALWLRDGGCRVPGCGRTRHLHAHHIKSWAEGGPTRLSNLVLVCSGHHRMIHEGRLESRICEGKITFVNARGRAMPAVAASGATGYELEELERFLRDADLYIDSSTAPTWDGSQSGIAEALDWMLLAERGLRAA
ncbi:MAG: DUF222 domain-containing protein [Enhygromyxa sp.]